MPDPRDGRSGVPPEAVRVGPFWWWRWAVVPRNRRDITGIGFWSKADALDFWQKASVFGPPFLLKRTGLRSYRVVR